MKIISADSHVVEPPTVWDEYCSSAVRPLAPRILRVGGTDRLICNGIELAPLGLLAGCLRDNDHVREAATWEEDIPAAAYDPVERMAAVRADGIAGEVLFPTVGMNFYLLDSPDLRGQLFNAYNRWLADLCRAAPELYRGLAVLAVESISGAVEELERACDDGLRGAVIPLFLRPGESYSEGKYWPLWDCASRLRMPVNLHSSTTRDRSKRWTEGSVATRLLRQPLQMQTVLLELIFSGVFDRFPELVLVSAENDAGWAGHLVERADYWWTRNRNLAVNAGQMMCERPPSSYFGGNVAATFMRDETCILASSVIGESAIMFGSDFPHHVSTWPNTVEVLGGQLDGVPSAVADAIASGNVSRLYGFG